MSARPPSAVPALSPISRKPACEIDEYARIRFTFRCTSAARFPIASDATAIPANAHVQRRASCANDVSSTRSASSSAATFVAADMNAVTGVGAPSYTSGVHMWNGAAEDLNASPATISASPSTSSRSPERPCPPTAFAISTKPSCPVAP